MRPAKRGAAGLVPSEAGGGRGVPAGAAEPGRPGEGPRLGAAGKSSAYLTVRLGAGAGRGVPGEGRRGRPVPREARRRERRRVTPANRPKGLDVGPLRASGWLAAGGRSAGSGAAAASAARRSGGAGVPAPSDSP